MQQLTISACSDKGRVRRHNEDMALINTHTLRDNAVATSIMLPDDGGRLVLAVCDGVGGCNAGDVASNHVATSLADAVAQLPTGLSVPQLMQAMREWHADEHDALNEDGASAPEHEGMGSTVVALLFYGPYVLWMNCGDSRMYRFRDGILAQLTTDHSLYAVTMNPDDRHIITNCLGTGSGCTSYIDIQDITSRVFPGDTYLLCSDGLTDALENVDIEALLAHGTTADRLVHAACEAGGPDNTTVILVTVNNSN